MFNDKNIQNFSNKTNRKIIHPTQPTSPILSHQKKRRVKNFFEENPQIFHDFSQQDGLFFSQSKLIFENETGPENFFMRRSPNLSGMSSPINSFIKSRNDFSYNSGMSGGTGLQQMAHSRMKQVIFNQKKERTLLNLRYQKRQWLGQAKDIPDKHKSYSSIKLPNASGNGLSATSTNMQQQFVQDQYLDSEKSINKAVIPDYSKRRMRRLNDKVISFCSEDQEKEIKVECKSIKVQNQKQRYFPNLKNKSNHPTEVSLPNYTFLSQKRKKMRKENLSFSLLNITENRNKIQNQQTNKFLRDLLQKNLTNLYVKANGIANQQLIQQLALQSQIHRVPVQKSDYQSSMSPKREVIIDMRGRGVLKIESSMLEDVQDI
ncbi:UNKNOWN [Stylonychia lemnae]|uniref:Uncharacterized protein n=1 Tax=Stylonychia lemnae TaxID=5949 RepID=A0A078B6M5_STYLE|nr:UNKNOWN [Stylonychia lemnae]|eukprot:CDW90190.1 UNKNOWN [Stylonychia lemnae]